MPDVEMPPDWNDAKGWENYYTALDPYDIPDYGSFRPDELPAFITQLLAEGWKTAWLPGCGMSPLPRLLARLGLDVHATDISPTAIAYQKSKDDEDYLPASGEPLHLAGMFTCHVHDFRQPYLENHFDIIFNVKAFQGFPPETMRQVAATHYQALKPGRHAYFDTMNVQGEQRDILEASLVEANFFIPFYELHRWYRQRLRETNISHVFVLGRPIVPMSKAYRRNEKRREHDKAILNEITKEFERKAQAEQENKQQKGTATERTAIVIYLTG